MLVKYESQQKPKYILTIYESMLRLFVHNLTSRHVFLFIAQMICTVSNCQFQTAPPHRTSSGRAIASSSVLHCRTFALCCPVRTSDHGAKVGELSVWVEDRNGPVDIQRELSLTFTKAVVREYHWMEYFLSRRVFPAAQWSLCYFFCCPGIQVFVSPTHLIVHHAQGRGFFFFSSFCSVYLACSAGW